MAFIITNGWDVAHHHIHEGFKHLGNSITANLSVTKTFEEVKNNSSWNNCLNLSGQVRAAFTLENKEAIKATALFQAGMEAWISWAYTKPELSGITKPGYFKPKWINAFTELGITNDFTDYGNFYSSQRNAIIHPGTQADIETVAKINSQDTFEGLKHGWIAMGAMSSGLGQPFDSNSFEIMCNANGVQLTEVANLGDLLDFEKQLLKKHREGIDEINKSLQQLSYNASK